MLTAWELKVGVNGAKELLPDQAQITGKDGWAKAVGERADGLQLGWCGSDGSGGIDGFDGFDGVDGSGGVAVSSGGSKLPLVKGLQGDRKISGDKLANDDSTKSSPLYTKLKGLVLMMCWDTTTMEKWLCLLTIPAPEVNFGSERSGSSRRVDKIDGEHPEGLPCVEGWWALVASMASMVSTAWRHISGRQATDETAKKILFFKNIRMIHPNCRLKPQNVDETPKGRFEQRLVSDQSSSSACRVAREEAHARSAKRSLSDTVRRCQI